MSPRQPENWQNIGPPAGGFAPTPAAPQFDIELGRIFLTMRNLLGVTLWDMARRVGAEPTVVADLEAGSLASLPPWPELERLVLAYASEAQIDPRPILARLAQTSGVNATMVQPSPRTITLQPNMVATAPMAEPVSYRSDLRALPAPQDYVLLPPKPTQQTAVKKKPAAERVRGDRAKRANAGRPAWFSDLSLQFAKLLLDKLRGLAGYSRAWIFALAAIPLLFLSLARFYPEALYATMAPLPSVASMPMRQGLDVVLNAFSPERDGLTWIEIGNPRVRKADRLPERAR